MKPQVSEAVRARRVVLHLSMRDAAKLAGLSPTAWSDLEAGKHPPTLKSQRGVAEALGWPVDWLARIERGEAADWATRPDDDPTTALRAQVADLAEQVAALSAGLAAMGAEVARLRDQRRRGGDE